MIDISETMLTFQNKNTVPDFIPNMSKQSNINDNNIIKQTIPIDIFNIKDSFFNDLCSPYSDSNNG